MALSETKIKSSKPGDKLSDGRGLRLDVDAKGNRAWVLRFKSPLTGKERYMGLGPFPVVTLDEARGKALAAQKLILDGLDPIEHRKEQRAIAEAKAAQSTTFRQYAEKFIARREVKWKNPKHRQQWTNSLRNYVFPLMGDVAISSVDTPHVLKVIEPIWHSKRETASRIRGRIEMILQSAKGERLRTGDNPASWQDCIKDVLGDDEKRRVVNHPALPYNLLPQFMASLRTDRSDTALLLQFIIHTAARYNEGAFAEWSEINEVEKLWTIPAARMKASADHTVPLSAAALEVLTAARERFGSDGMIFPGMRRGQPLSDVSLAKAIKRHTDVKATTHGFRATFATWAEECTEYAEGVREAALAHKYKSDTVAAYQRGAKLEKRRLLMDDWAAYCSSALKETGGETLS